MSLRPHRNIFQYFESSEPKLDDSDNDSDYVPEKRAKSKSRSNSRSVFDENEPGPSGLNQTIEPGASESGSTNRSSEILQTNGSDVDYSSDSESDDMEVNETEEFDIAVRRDPAADEEWSEDLTNFPHIPEFPGHSGLNDQIDRHNWTAKSCYDLFIDDELVRFLKEETNRYAAELSRTAPYRDFAVVKQWKTVTLMEIRGFLLVLLHMGTFHKPAISDYWSTEEFIESRFASKVLSRDRFRAILSMLHFSDNAHYLPIDHPNHDPLYKIRGVYQHLQNRFQEVYVPNKHVSLDEAMCPWRGKLRFKVFLKDKPTPWGIKFYELSEAQSAYVYRFEIYAADTRLSNKPTDVVMRLAEPLLDKGFHIFTDNYYSCPALFEKLIERKTMCTGTVRANRLGMPKDLAKLSLKKDDIAFRRKGNLVALRWKDKRDVNILTSIHNPTETKTITTRNVTDKIKPVAVVEYSKHMSGADKIDQLLAYFPLARRTSKWTTKVFMHLFTLSVIQSSIIYNKLQTLNNLKKTPLPVFIKQLGKELTILYVSERNATPNRPPPKSVKKPQTLLRLNHSAISFHCLGHLPPTSSNPKPRRACKVCYDRLPNESGKRKRAKETYLWCTVCEIPLCLEPCFKIFHTKVNYVAEN